MTIKKDKLLIGTILCIVLCIALALAGCTSTTPTPGTTTVPTTGVKVTTSQPTQVQTSPVATTKPVTVNTSPAQKNLIAFTAASLSGASDSLGPAFYNTSGTKVKFNLDGTQVLKTQVEQGAPADVFISASNTYTNALKSEGYLVNSTVKNLTSNYIIVIIPAGNPGNIHSLADLGTPGKRIAMGTPDVPVGVNTRQVIAKLTNSTFNSTWNQTLYNNVKTFETTEPGVVTKVALGEVDAGFVYESSYKAAKNGTLSAVNIPVKDNSLQIYTIGIINSTADKAGAQLFEDFMLSPAGQKILSDFGFRPYGS
jgi:molybdate transport system substrate-binding protein